MKVSQAFIRYAQAVYSAPKSVHHDGSWYIPKEGCDEISGAMGHLQEEDIDILDRNRYLQKHAPVVIKAGVL